MSEKNIESILLEERTFAPSPAFTARARIKPDDLAQLHAQARADYVGFWAGLAVRELKWQVPFTRALDDSRRTQLPLVHRRAAECLGELPRRAPGRARRQDRDHLRGRAGRHAAPELPGAARRGVPLRQRAEGAGHQARRSRHHLHAAGARSDRGHARLQSHRRDSLGGVRRLLGRGAAGPHRGHPGEARDHGRRRLARWPGRGTEGGGRQGARRRLCQRRARHRPQAHRQARADERAARPVVARGDRGPAAEL